MAIFSVAARPVLASSAATTSKAITTFSSGQYGNVVPTTTSQTYTKIFKKKLTAYKDDFYTYLFNEGSELVYIIGSAKISSAKDEFIATGQAEGIAKEFAKKALPQFFDLTYEVSVKEADARYVVDFEQTDESVLTGNKINVVLMKDGKLKSLQLTRSDYDPKNKTKTISSSSAVDLAYIVITSRQKSIEEELTKAMVENKVVIDIKNRKEHEVKKKLTYYSKQICWLIEVRKVKLHSDKADTINFSLYLNAENGVVKNFEYHVK
jgi:hypothetical protein